jgi:uridine phosphorylase
LFESNYSRIESTFCRGDLRTRGVLTYEPAYGDMKRVMVEADELWFAGAIDPALEPGDIVVLKGAFSDEGTSRHYFRGGTWFGSSRNLIRRLEKSLREGGMKYTLGEAWTTDAPYRETREKVARYRRMGSRVVNMESSAVFAVSSYRRVEATSIKIVSDVVSEEKWYPGFHRERVSERGQDALSAVLRTIKG